MRLGASGVVRAGSGIGVLQRALYPRLSNSGYEISLSRNRDLGRGFSNAIRGGIRGLSRAGGPYSVYLSAVPPLPVGLSVPCVAIVHDLRWRSTRGRLARLYRDWDLRRTVARAQVVVCVSDRTREDLIAYLPDATEKSVVAWLGPGLFDGPQPASSKVAGSALLVGGAPHKQNELAAEVIGRLPRTLISSVSGVGLSERARLILERALGAENCRWSSHISDEEMRNEYRTAEYFVLLGTDEGFGLPYIEALCAGCTVIAADQQLTREVLDEAGILVSAREPSDIVREVLNAVRPDESQLSSVAARYSWDIFAASIREALDRARMIGKSE